jgi:hypothetical protein
MQVVRTKSNMWAAIALIFLIWAVGATAGMVYYYQTSDTQQKTINSLNSLLQTTTYKCNIAINYGNSTIIWHNNTVIPIGFTLFNATQKVASLQYQTTFGIFVTAINGVSQDTAAGKYWVYDGLVNGTWEAIWIGAAEYQMQNNDTIMWSLKTF